MFKKLFKPFSGLFDVFGGTKAMAGPILGNKPKTTGFEQTDYESMLKRSASLLSGDGLTFDPAATLKEETSRKDKVDPQKAKSLLEAIRTRQGEVAARKGLTQTKTSLLG